MKNLICLILVACCMLTRGFPQDGQKSVVLEINPDFLTTNKNLDSVIQYIYSSDYDSSLLHKWGYSISENGLHQSKQHYWRDSTRDWIATDLHEWEFNGSGKLILKSHYDRPFSNGTWGGCESDGCGKKDWDFDKNGNQILFTQSYFTNARKWEVFYIQENQYDELNNMILDSYLEKRFDGGEYYWQGYKNEYSFDERGYQAGHVNYRWSIWHPIDGREYRDWYPQFKEELDYNNSGKKTMQAFFAWDHWNHEWRCGDLGFNMGKAEWGYSPDGQDNNVSVYVSCDSLVFEGSNKYGENGQIISKVEVAQPNVGPRVFWPIFLPFSGLDVTFQPIKRNVEYDIDYRVQSEEVFSWRPSSASWYKSALIRYDYDQQGLLACREYYPLSEHSEPGNVNLKDEKSYDKNGNVILESYYKWDSELNAWIGREKYWNEEEDIADPGRLEYEYDDNGNLVQFASYKWSSRSNNWIGYKNSGGKKKWGYDVNDCLFQESRYDWDNDLSAWVPKQTNRFEYDDAGNPLIQYQYAWEPETESWDLVLKYFYYYSQSSGYKEVISPMITIFPNPTLGIINFSGLTQAVDVELYSAMGQLLKSEKRVERSIDISNLPAGTYYLNYTDGKEILKKIIIKR